MSSNKDAPPGSGQPRSSLDDEDLEIDFGFEQPPPPRLNLGNKPELRRILSRLQEGSKTRQERPTDPARQPRLPEVARQEKLPEAARQQRSPDAVARQERLPEAARQQRPPDAVARQEAPPAATRQEGPPEVARQEKLPEAARQERSPEMPAPPAAMPQVVLAPEPEEEPAEEPPLFYELRAKERPKLIIAGGVDEARAYMPPTKVQAPTTRGKVMETLRVKIKETPEPAAPIDPRTAVTTRVKPGTGTPLDPRKAATVRMKPRDPTDPRQAVTMRVAPPDPANPRQAATMKLPQRDPLDPRHAIARRMDLRPFGQVSGDELADSEEVDLHDEYEEIGPTQAPRKLPEPHTYPEEPAEEEPGLRIGVWLAVILSAAILGGGIALLVRKSAMSNDAATTGAGRPVIVAPQDAAASPSSAVPKAPAPP